MSPQRRAPRGGSGRPSACGRALSDGLGRPGRDAVDYCLAGGEGLPPYPLASLASRQGGAAASCLWSGRGRLRGSVPCDQRLGPASRGWLGRSRPEGCTARVTKRMGRKDRRSHLNYRRPLLGPIDIAALAGLVQLLLVWLILKKPDIEELLSCNSCHFHACRGQWKSRGNGRRL